jgi:hypothetical protein
MTTPAPVTADHIGGGSVAEGALHDDAPAPKVLIPLLVLAAFGLYLASLTPPIITRCAVHRDPDRRSRLHRRPAPVRSPQ